MRKLMVRILVSVCPGILLLTALPAPGAAWSNGGWSYDCESPTYGTHDYLALNALLWVKEHYDGDPEHWQWIERNLDYYLLGTEAPDNPEIINCGFLCPLVDYDDFGNTQFHHVYWNYNQTYMCDDASAEWAETSYNRAVEALSRCEFRRAAFYLGACTHYIADPGVFLHIMDDDACYRSVFDFEEYPCHTNYEDWVDDVVEQGGNPFLLSFDGKVVITSAYDATREVSRITDRGNWDEVDPTKRGYTRDCMWMLEHCDMVEDPYHPETSQEFFLSTADSLNRCANAIADVLPGVYRDARLECPDLNLTINKTYVGANDPLRITAHVFNPQYDQETYFFAVLEAYGEWFWYPDWGPDMDAEIREFYFGNAEIPIIDIPSMPPAAPGGPFTLYVALTEIFTYNLIDFDFVTFFLI
ncbi:zinc dependent phospholipase C family protein [bacterium]|nr:zinc dependent phospholipase C family protein [candidate division CSSED10-310 bacterium]